jgi:hypothetical protein
MPMPRIFFLCLEASVMETGMYKDDGGGIERTLGYPV